VASAAGGAGMVLGDDAVVMQLAAAGEESVITVNCPDEAGLGCDLCRTILEFGLRITRGGMLSPPQHLLRVVSFGFATSKLLLLGDNH
jgi:hypothetical protein